ncbi:MAG: HD domain-containing protein [Peptococcaceae bacterium]|nr:MAG: HD domain-containing protein [Peptococcaceae bacterium]
MTLYMEAGFLLRKLGGCGFMVKVARSSDYKTKYSDIFDLPMLQEVVDRLAENLGMALLVTDVEGVPVTRMSNLCRFCTLINRSEEGRRRCADARVKDTGLVVKTMQDELCMCYAGLVHIVVPIELHELPLAVLIGGNIILEMPEKEGIYKLADELGIDPGELWAAVGEIPVWERNELYERVRLFSTVATVVSRLFYERYQLQQMVTLNRRITSSLNVEAVCSRTVYAAGEMIRAKHCILRLFDEEKQELIVKALYGLTEELTAGEVVLSLPGTVQELVLRTGEPFVAKETASGGITRNGFLDDEGIHALLIVPLSVRDKVIGTLETYFITPRDITGWDASIILTIARQAAAAIENARNFENQRSYYLAALQAMVAASEAKDLYTRGHSLRVAQYADTMVRLMGRPEEEAEEIYIAGLLHDIGKIGIREEILLKPSRLTPEERREVETHPLVGAKILEPANFPPGVILAVRHHHENIGGDGYPDRLEKDQICLGARILRVADAFDAMTSNRPYRRSMPAKRAVSELQRCAGTQFDEEVVRVFLKAMEKEKCRVLKSGEEGPLLDVLMNALSVISSLRIIEPQMGRKKIV